VLLLVVVPNGFLICRLEIVDVQHLAGPAALAKRASKTFPRPLAAEGNRSVWVASEFGLIARALVKSANQIGFLLFG
jgi:hypothetical protein